MIIDGAFNRDKLIEFSVAPVVDGMRRAGRVEDVPLAQTA